MKWTVTLTMTVLAETAEEAKVEACERLTGGDYDSDCIEVEKEV